MQVQSCVGSPIRQLHWNNKGQLSLSKPYLTPKTMTVPFQQHTCANELAQPWLAVNSHFMTPKTMEATARKCKFLALQSWHSHGLQKQSTPSLWNRRLWRWQLRSSSSSSYGTGTAMACSQLPLYDTADYGGDNSAVQVPCTTELAQPWLAESTGFTTQDGFLRFSLNHATKTYFSGSVGRSPGWIPEIHWITGSHPGPHIICLDDISSRWPSAKKCVKQQSLHDSNWKAKLDDIIKMAISQKCVSWLWRSLKLQNPSRQKLKN